MLAMIDNYDSFTYNLVQYFGELGADIRVFRNDQVTLEELAAFEPAQLVVSPGPGDPDDGGISNQAILHFAGRIPVLGVCLGHQCLGAVFGGKVSRAPRLMHGKTSAIYHDGRGLSPGCPRRSRPPVTIRSSSNSLSHSASKSRPAPPKARLWACSTGSTLRLACSFTRNRS